MSIATERQQGLFCHLLHNSGLYKELNIDGIIAMKIAKTMDFDLISDCIDSLKAYDAGYGNGNEKQWFLSTFKPLCATHTSTSLTSPDGKDCPPGF